jgi:radical SAM protein with 4Fe4S-binding SPASM domain
MLYKQILMKSFSFRHPWRVFTNALYAFRSGERAPMPFKLKLENTTYCNLRCKMCPYTNGLKRKQGSLSFENFKYIFDQVNPCYLNLTGIGEPFMNRDIFEIIKYAKKKKAFVKLDTNGMLLNKENSEKLLEAKPDILSISLDGMKKETFEKIRGGAIFEIVRGNIKRIAMLKKEGNYKTDIHIFMVVQKENINEVADFIKFGDEVGVDSINGTFVISLGDSKNTESSLDNVDKETIKKVYYEILKVKKDLKTNLWMDNMLNYMKYRIEGRKWHYNIGKPCYLPWYMASFTWDGTLVPCDFHCDNEITFGNIFETPFKELWNGKETRKFRRKLIRKRIGICGSCGVEEDYLYNKFRIFYKIPFFKNWGFKL